MKNEATGRKCREDQGIVTDLGPDGDLENALTGSIVLGKRGSLQNGIVIGRLRGWDDAAEPLVDFPGNPLDEPLPARSTAVLNEGHIGRDVALMFEAGDPERPVVIGPVLDPGKSRVEPPAEQKPFDVQVDGETITLTGNKQIVLKCGKASITLTRAGKILIRGAYLLNRSAGVNRIKGGSVQIN